MILSRMSDSLDHNRVQEMLEGMQDIVAGAGANEKQELTSEVKRFCIERIALISAKIERGEKLSSEDLKFVEQVKGWVKIPETIRKQYPTIESVSTGDFEKNCREKGLSINQWVCLLHMAEASGKGTVWLDSPDFTYDKSGKIMVTENLDLEDCTGLTSLPSGLCVGGYLNLVGCTGLTSLPPGLCVGGYLNLVGCIGLTSLPPSLSVRWSLVLEGCTGLTSLPPSLSVRGILSLADCTGLTSLPPGLSVKGNLYLGGCRLEVIRKARELKQQGRIQGEVIETSLMTGKHE